VHQFSYKDAVTSGVR